MNGRLCQFRGDANTENGQLVPCSRKAEVVMRIRGIEGIAMGKPAVCSAHMELLLSTKVRSAGRDWQIDHWLPRDRP